MTTETNHHDLETVTAVAKSLHAHHDRRARMRAGNMWNERKWADLDDVCREEFMDVAANIVMAVQGTETTNEAADTLARLYAHHGPALTKYAAYFHARITETLSDVPGLTSTKE